MSSREEKLAKSLTAESIELTPFLPYLLQDLWELGSSPKDMINLISRNIDITKNTRILDLACGKGAVSVNMAKKFGCQVKGIEIMSDFIVVAKQKSQEHNVQHLCDFIIADINESVKIEKGYDVVILGAVGDVLGNQEETLLKLSATIKEEGHILIDDGYAKSTSEGPYLSKEKWLEIIGRSGFELVEDLLVNEIDFSGVLEDQEASIKIRTSELKDKYPDKVHLFEQYMESQIAECDELENDIIGVTILLKKRKF